MDELKTKTLKRKIFRNSFTAKKPHKRLHLSSVSVSALTFSNSKRVQKILKCGVSFNSAQTTNPNELMVINWEQDCLGPVHELILHFPAAFTASPAELLP